MAGDAHQFQMGVVADQHRRKTDERVQRRHKLRHFRHLHARGDEPANHGPDRDHQRDDPDVGHIRRQHRGRHRQRHAGDAIPDRPLGTFLTRQTAKGQDEQNGCRDIGGAAQYRCSWRSPHDFWNMASIRRVTRKPPTILIVAISTEMAASTTTSQLPDPICNSAPRIDDARNGVGDGHQRRVQASG